MSISYLVTGHFANGQTRVAGLHWPGGQFRGGDGEFVTAFKARSKQYAEVFKQELEESPKQPNGMPKFEYIDVQYQVHGTRSGNTAFAKLCIALTPKALEKLRRGTDVKGDFSNVNIRSAHFNNPRGYALADLTKQMQARNPEAVWSKIRAYASVVYSQAFNPNYNNI